MSENTENRPSSGEGAGKREGGRGPARGGKPFGNKKPGGFGGKGKGFGGKGRGERRDGDREGGRGGYRDGERGGRDGGRGGKPFGKRDGKPFEKREGDRDFKGGKRFDKGGKPFNKDGKRFDKRDDNRGPREDKPFEKREGSRGERRDGRPFEKKYYSYEAGEGKREGKRDFKGGKSFNKDGKPFEKREGDRDFKGGKRFDKGEGKSFGKKSFSRDGERGGRDGERGGFRKDRNDRGPARGGKPFEKRDGDRGFKGGKPFEKRFDKPEKGFDVGNDEKSIPEEFLTFEELGDLRALPGTEVTHKEYGRGVIDSCDAAGLMRVKFHTVGLKFYNCEKALKTDTLRIRRPEN